MKCTDCKAILWVAFMCDLDIPQNVDDCYHCEKCFDTHPCRVLPHEEGCETKVFAGGEVVSVEDVLAKHGRDYDDPAAQVEKLLKELQEWQDKNLKLNTVLSWIATKSVNDPDVSGWKHLARWMQERAKIALDIPTPMDGDIGVEQEEAERL